MDAIISFVYAHHTVFAFVAVVFSFFVYQVQIRPRYVSKLRHLPGPTYGHWLWGRFGEILAAEAGVLQMEWADKYAKDGKVVKAVGPFGIERLMFLTPEALQTILVDECYNFPRPDFVRDTLGLVTGNGLLTVEDDAHRNMKKLMSPAFSNAHLAQLVPEFYGPINSCIEIINEEIQKAEKEKKEGTSDDKEDGAIIDVYPLMSRTTLDIICDTSFGYKCDSLRNPHNELAEAYEDLINLQDGINLAHLVVTVSIPFGTRLTPYIAALGRKVPLPGRLPTIITFEDSMARIRKVSEKLLNEKTQVVDGEEAKTGKDVLSLLVKTNTPDEKGNVVMSREQMIDQVLTILGAGHETTASGMTWTMWLLAQHPAVQDKLRAEVSEMLGHVPEPDMMDLKGLKYLDAVVKESLRVMPPVPMTFRKAKKDMVVDGIFVPSQTIIYMGNRVMNTLPRVWGEDAREFRPERWFELPKDFNHINFQSFISGPHQCIGNHMSVIEMKAMLAHFIANFSFEKVSPDQKVIPTAAITMKPKDGLPLRVKRVNTLANAIS